MHKETIRFFFIFLGATVGLSSISYLLLTTLGVANPDSKAAIMGNNDRNGNAIVEIYTLPHCPYCIKAKALLDKKGIKYREFDVSQDQELRQQMVARSQGRRTVPQIFIHSQHLGGFDDLRRSEKIGELDKMLTSTDAEEMPSEN